MNLFRHAVMTLTLLLAVQTSLAAADSLRDEVSAVYSDKLKDLFLYFHQNPELSTMEHKTSARLADELESLGYVVHRNVGGTGIVALLENGDGPLVMFRADMDGLPVEEKSGLAYASRAKQIDPNGNEVFVMHACGHDVHITSLVGTAQLMAEKRDEWQGTLMLIGQPAEERVLGAAAMRADNLWQRFGQPDYAMAFHVTSAMPTGLLGASVDSPYSGADTVDIYITGVGAHGASPHRGVDPIVLGSQIVMGLQTVVSRTLPPRRPGVITVGAFHSGTKHNIISDAAHLQLTVRSESAEDRTLLLDGIRRVAENMGRVAGLPDELLPKVVVSEESVPPTLNDKALTERIMALWNGHFGAGVLFSGERLGMGAEDFPFFTVDPYIPSLYFAVGGTPPEDFAIEQSGGDPVPSHHSPLFKIEPDASVTMGVEASVTALLDLLGS
ncbi:MAG: amidohydrolase [Proteobacteria bacterium]|nr:amidohydrolase [Luminiphilus sp.]MBL6820433.1 amidohydrolase [Luminiphilus sp.]MDA0649962.1 amidohydrolase [Pseudomonadota bacterium]